VKPALWTFLAIVGLVLAVALLFTYSGAYNVAALSSSGGIVDWLASTMMDHSVRAHASGIKVPGLDDSTLVALGFDHYKEMCIACHGSPAGGMSEAGMGLNPKAPELSEAARDWGPAELYWIIKNGVKMTGMPAFAPTHSERELWAMVAFLQKLKNMTPAEYKALASATGKESEEDEHGKGNAQADHHHQMSD
jgi:mono/diheme cytochrome c family protein